MQVRYPTATWRPLGFQTEPLIGVPRVLIAHTIVGYLRSTDAMFRREGYQGTESHFGVGGPWDGEENDGAVWQWQSIDRQADAQNAGNAYATSIETSDGGDPKRPWSPRQLNALVALGVWWCRTTGNPARLVTTPDQTGIGYHAQFKEWAPDGRSCPGPARIGQLRDVVIPRIRTELSAPTAPTPQEDPDMPLTADEITRIAEAVWGAHWNGETAGTRLYYASRAGATTDFVDAVADAVARKLPTAHGPGITVGDVKAAVVAVLTEGTAAR